MKISKSLFLAFAGLGLFACSNEDELQRMVYLVAKVLLQYN